MEYLLKYCTTERQREQVEAYFTHGSVKKAARALGVDHSSLARNLRAVKHRAAKAGDDPAHGLVHPAPEGYKVKGTSTLYSQDGQKLQWVKTDVDREKQEELMREAVAALCEGIQPEPPAKYKPKQTAADLLSCYIITDYHLGMLAWHEETRDSDWDIEIAEDTLYSWFSSVMQSTPESETGMIAILGDLLHWDGMEAITPNHGHVLDADTRFQKVVRVAIRALRRVVQTLLQKHSHVHMIIAEGNHDPASGAWLREMFSALYDEEPRVTVDVSPDPYYCYEHGDVSLFFHHGHLKKPEQIDDVFASKFREVFGRTKHSYAHMGHRHHGKMLETNLMVVEQHRTLAAPDAFASRGGWLSGRDAKAVTYHKTGGEVARCSVSADMLK